jgi:hypothetical protein
MGAMMKSRNKPESRRKKKGGKADAMSHPANELMFLRDFLNAQSQEEFLASLDEVEARRFGLSWIRRAWKVKNQILEDLRLLTDFVTPSKAIHALRVLVSKLNNLGLTPSWGIWPANPTFNIYSGGKQRGKIPNPGWKRLGAGQGTIQVGKQHFIISMNFENERHPGKYLYALIACALQTGGLEHLRRCQWEKCRRFFLRKDLRRTAYCDEVCADAYDRHNAAERVRKSRERARNAEGNRPKKLLPVRLPLWRAGGKI